MAQPESHPNDDIDVDIEDEGRCLVLNCGPVAFEKYKSLIARELAPITDAPLDGIQGIQIQAVSPGDLAQPGQGRGWVFGIFAVAAFLLMLFALVVGIVQIVNWIAGRIGN
jgi:hypothetical protein